jgi:hypothetical protein
MNKTVLDLSEGIVEKLPVDTAISFKPFMDHLQRRAAEEHTVKAKLYKATLDIFNSRNVYDLEIPIEDMHQYDELLEHMYMCLSSPMAAEKDLAWGLCSPLNPMVFYGTELLYELMATRQDYQEMYIVTKTPEDHHRERLQFIYSFILKKLYNFQVPVHSEKFHGATNLNTGLEEYYGISINLDFIDVAAKGELPALDFKKLYTKLSDGVGYEILEGILPLHLFSFRGIGTLTVSDITPRKAVENIQKIRLASSPGSDDAGYKSVMQSLKTLVRDNNIEFDLFPFVRVNNEPVYGYAKGGTGVLFSVWGEDRLSMEAFQHQAKGYAAHPRFFFSEDITTPADKETPFLGHFRGLGVCSLALMPVFNKHVLVGVLCMHTWKGHTFDESVLALLEPAISAIEQVSQVYIDEFNLEIENIVKEQFTSIQASVQWKFNEAAWQYLYNKKKGLPTKAAPICFNDVYPLYGAVDIRNSTVERNKAIIADLDVQLTELLHTLTTLQQSDHSALMDELIFKSRRWKEELLKHDQLQASDENNLNIFFEEEIKPYLMHLSAQEATIKSIIDPYLESLNSANTSKHSNRHSLETAMQTINNAVSEYFESEKGALQQPYPCYFEKFRTDGVEYDMYIGQSIAPDKPFSQFHLKNLRLWQLSSMAAIAKITHSLLPHMATELHTTQLIFIHDHTINIGFRSDERKFDVEGAYSIRYQMIKKRIDKVHIRNTNERLTQPDKIVLIYFDKGDIRDYVPFIQYLQDKKVLHNDLEELELEDLQGLSGLKALRVGVVY